MAVEERLFLGVKQVTNLTFSELQDSDKIGYLWYVRHEDPEYFEIYLGTRRYGQTNEVIESALTKEIADRIAADSALTIALKQETAARISGDTMLQSALTKETENRIAADSALTIALEHETEARISGDTILQSAITKETENRIAADSALTIALEEEESARISGDTELQSAITKEVEDRITADSALTVALEQEAENRISGDTLLQSAITKETEDRIAVDSALTIAIGEEVNARISGDTELLSAITKETNDRVAADSALTIALGQEAASRISGDTELQSAITKEVEDRIAADSALTIALSGKSDTGHTHEQYSVTGHTHLISDVSGLTEALSAKTASYTAGTNIEITGTGNSINAIGYVYDTTKSSFATGLNTTASGNYSHAEGIGTSANGWCAHTEGDGTETSADNSCEHAEGRFNASHTGETDAQKTRHSIGIGSDANHRANAFEVMANGDVYINGVGGYDGTNPTSAQTVSQAIPTKTSDLTNDSGFITGYTESDPTVPSWAKQPNKPTYTAQEVGALPSSTTIPSKTSDLTNDSGFITGYTESDPTVPSWAKQPSKPSYTASEVGALPSSTTIPSKTSDLTNDSGFISGYTETDPTVPSWAKQPNKPTYTAQEVGALPSSTTIPSKTSDLTNDSGFITGYTETDPTVPAWAKEANKPTYVVSEISGLTDALNSKSNTGHTHDQYSLTGHTHTAQEIGALPDDTFIPSKTSELTNDSGFIVIDDNSASTGKTYSSTKITKMVADTSFNIEIVDTLPVTGDTHTIYFVPNPSSLIPEAEANLILYNDKSGVTTVDVALSTASQTLTGLTIGDVFKYVDDGSESQTQPYFNFSVRTEINDSGDTIYKIDNDLNDHILYNIGDTFRVINVDPEFSVAFTTIGNNPSIEDGSYELKGINGHIALENNKIYRLTGYYSANYPEELEEIFPYEIEGVYFATYVEVPDAVTADYMIDNLGSVQIRTFQKQYIVPSEIDKGNIELSIVMYENMLYDFHFNSGVVSAITLQDGHYYKIKGYYILKPNQVVGAYGVYVELDNIGYIVYTFEEVENPTTVKYNDITYIPGTQLLNNYEYSKYPKSFCEIYKTEEIDPQTHETIVSYHTNDDSMFYGQGFPQIKVGQTVKIIGENTGRENNPFVVITEVDDESLSIDSGLEGIVSASVWAKNEIYKCTGYHTVASRNNNSIFLIPTFDKMLNLSEADFEANTIPGFAMTKFNSDSVMTEWMWVDNDWELIGNTKVDLSNYYTKDETYSKSDVDTLLSGKSNTGHTHEQYSVTGHTHEMSDISGLDTALSGKSNTGHTHDQYSLTGHTHSEYLTKTEFESAAYALSSHINELTERANTNDAIQNITVEEVINELNIIDNN